MSNQRHTPGPWHMRLSDNATPHIEHGDCLRYDVGDLEFRVCVMPAEIMQSFNSFANARLIAAAPDLLDALKYARRFLKPSDHDTAFVDAAIAKATGGEA